MAITRTPVSVLLFALMLCFFTSAAQTQNPPPPIITLFDYLNVSRAEIEKAAPHFPWDKNVAPDKYRQKLDSWLHNYTEEWSRLLAVKGIAGREIGWESYGIASKYIPRKQIFESSYWQWYSAGGLSEEKRKQLFPHFPIPVNFDNNPANIQQYNGRVGMWMRLYPKEYNVFVNTPELAKLTMAEDKNTSVKIDYSPKFLGALVTKMFPEKKEIKTISDEFEYERAVRNWYFIYKPDSFNILYGKDYDFPHDFDVQHYRQSMLKKIEAKEKGLQGEDDHKWQNLQVSPTEGTMEWNFKPNENR